MNASCALQHFCDLHGPQILLCTEAKTYAREITDHDNDDLKLFYSQYIKSENPHGKLECKSCTLSSDALLVSTMDVAERMLFISSPSTPNQELYKNMRNACVRSLNIERSAENDHPVLFGDDESGYCLSLVFSCKDFHARGSQRLYALCYLCDDKHHLLSLMAVISSCMRQIVYWLQTDANQTYEQEGHIRVNMNFNGTSSKATYVLRPPPRTPSQRMLSDITHDSNLIYRIHALFVWLLRTANSAIHETLYDALPTEEQTMQQERKDTFPHVFMKRRTRTIVHNAGLLDTQNSVLIASTLMNTTQASSNYPEPVLDDDEDDYDSLQYQFSSYGNAALNLFREFITKLNSSEHLEFILYHWVIGNQLIIKYTNYMEDKDFVRALVSVLRLLLPDGCCHLMEVTDRSTLLTANLLLVDTDLAAPDIEGSADKSAIVIKIIFDNIEDHLRVAKLETLPTANSESLIPTYVKAIVGILMDSHLDDDAFETMIIQQKIKYLNKAKLYFQLGRCEIASTLSLNERDQMNLLQIEHPTDLLLIRFWQKGLSQAYKSQIRMLKQNANQQQQAKAK